MKIEEGKTGGKIIWDKEDFITGLVPNYTTSVVPVARGGNQMSYSSSMNPFRSLGYPLPGYRPVQVTNNSVVTSTLLKGVVNATVANIISSGALVHQLTIADPGTLNVSPVTIVPTSGNTPTGNDCVQYYGQISGSYTQNFFFSYNSSSIWNVGMYNLGSFAGGSFNFDFMSTVPATPLASPDIMPGAGYPHPLIVGDDNVMYIGDRNYIHAYDGNTGTNGTFFRAVVQLKAQWIITSMAKTDTGLMIFAYSSNIIGGGSATGNFRGQARAFLWNYDELDITKSYDLNDNFTSEGFTIGTTIGVFTYGRITDPSEPSKYAKIQLFDGTKFTPEVSFFGNLPVRGGVEVQGNNITWNSSGAIYSYGSKVLGEKSGLHNLSHGTGNSSGLCATFFDANQVLSVSSGTTSSGGMEVFDTNFQENSAFLSSLAEPYFPTFLKGRVKNVKIEFSNVISDPAATTELNLKLYDRNGTALATILSTFTDAISSSPRIIQRQHDTSNAPLPSFDGLGLYVQWTKANGIATQSFGIARVELEYEHVNINNVTT